MEHLPEDCLLAVFNKLESFPDRNAFGLTCRRWLALQNAARTSLSLQLCYNPDAHKIYTSHLPSLLARFPHLLSLSFTGCVDLPEAVLRRLPDSTAGLQCLSFYYSTALSDGALSVVSAGCPHLVSVVLYRSNITNRGLECLAGSCPALENVNLSYSFQVSDGGVAALSRGCRRLRLLMITSCGREVSGRGLAGCSPALAYLEADSCALTPEGLRAAVSGGGLEYLNVSGIKSWNGGDGLGVIGGAAQLRVLNLRMCRFSGDESEWNLALCHAVGAAGWSAVAGASKKLKVLHVNRCRNLCDVGLAALRGGCGRLEVLFIEGCPQLTPQALEEFRLARGAVEVKTEERHSIGPRLDYFFRPPSL
ncbi:unnamed protein product [Spirodela intermedia]|uniref:Uncharacterized protein n=1 Tax=Spirodela intermedia TaxID=51605 RepID=A0A7I8JEB5_SPIIN|nr:unnamed protein product [Spirodela intermedia]CAA6667742.1 unnamed protein product [Spirodela intermedia]